jgi:hypothetical protein
LWGADSRKRQYGTSPRRVEHRTKRRSALGAFTRKPFVLSKNFRIATIRLAIGFDPLPCLFKKFDRISWDNVA